MPTGTRQVTGETIAVAAAQMKAEPLEHAEAALEAIERLARRAADRRVELLVLPECAYPSYVLGSPQQYRSADVLTGHAYLQHVAKLARSLSLHIITGFVEEEDDQFYNAAACIDRHGTVLGTYRKQMLWDVDHDIFSPGRDIEPIDTELGRIGMIICADARVPEIVATLAARGAQIIAMPTAWVNTSVPDMPPRNPQPEFLIEARSREFSLPFVCANKSGRENDRLSFCGLSRVTRSNGSTAAEAPASGEALIAARVLVQSPHRFWMVESRRKRVVANDGTTATSETEPHPITIEAVPRVVITHVMDQDPQGYFKSLRNKGVDLLVTNLAQENEAEVLTQQAALYDLSVLAFPTTSRVRNLLDARVGCVAPQATRSFASSRGLVLDGAELLCAFTPEPDAAILRARALENRVYVIAAGITAAMLISPDGTIMHQTDAHRTPTARGTVNPAQAADKTVAPRTDIFRARQPDAYAI